MIVGTENDEPFEEPSISPACIEVKNPNINLSSYVERYTDLAGLNRLKFIAEVCPKLRIEALGKAINQVKTTFNVKLYDQLYKSFSSALQKKNNKSVKSRKGGDKSSSHTTKQSVQYDSIWVEDNTTESTSILQDLNSELNYKKANSGNSYVRRIIEEIGDYHVKSGNYYLAIKFYARARNYCTQTENVVNVFRNLIRVSIYMNNWWHVLSYIDEAKQYAMGFESLGKSVTSRLACAAGLANMSLEIYETAAHCFLLTPFDNYDYVQIVAPEDVCSYASLCALATLDRETLELGVLNSEGFKPFFAMTPKMWKIVAKFYEGDFNECTKLLSEIEDRMRLDVYLAPHVTNLYEKIFIRIADAKNK